MNTKFNKRRYASRSIFWAQMSIAFVALFALMMLCAIGNPLVGLILFSLVGLSLNKQTHYLNAVTLTVPEIMTDVLDAFKLETPEIFGPNGFATDFSSKTAVLGDTITAKISKVPVTGAYDRANGGFKNAAQDVNTLWEDVPVTLDQFRIVTVNVNWLVQLASKLQLYQQAVKDYGYALSKYVLDSVLAKLVLANLSNRIQTPIANINLDYIDMTVRDQMNTQKMVDTGRFMIVNTPVASKLGSDDRIRSGDFFGQRNGERGYRRWQNIGGLSWIREYPDFPANGIGLYGYAAERRGVVVATRAMDFSNVARQLGVTEVMQFHPLSDELSGIHMTGAAWQEAGTGDVYVSAGILFGTAVGKQGGAAGTITDNGGVLLST